MGDDVSDAEELRAAGRRPGPIDSDTWKAAIWSAPLTVQLVLASAIATNRGLSTIGHFNPRDSIGLLAGAGTAALVAAVTAAALRRSPVGRTRGIGLSLAASAMTVAVSAAIVGWLFYE